MQSTKDEVKKYILEITNGVVLLNNFHVEKLITIIGGDPSMQQGIGEASIWRFDGNNGSWIRTRTIKVADEKMNNLTIKDVPAEYFFYRHDLVLSNGSSLGTYYTSNSSLFD